jgi:hypothetical protein
LRIGGSSANGHVNDCANRCHVVFDGQVSRLAIQIRCGSLSVNWSSRSQFVEPVVLMVKPREVLLVVRRRTTSTSTYCLPAPLYLKSLQQIPITIEQLTLRIKKGRIWSCLTRTLKIITYNIEVAITLQNTSMCT